MCISDFSHYSGNILKKKEDIHANKILEEIETAVANAGLKIGGKRIYSYVKGSFLIICKISDTIENMRNKQKRISLYIFHKIEIKQDFDWIIKGGNLTYAVNIEEIDGREKLVLDFLYEYLKLNPEDIFWNQYEWYYDYETIKEIKEKEFDPEWCYKKPKTKKKYHMPIHLRGSNTKKMKCKICGKKEMGKVEKIEGKKYYGYYCTSCKEWSMKFPTPLPLFLKLVFYDNRIYKLKLAGGENRYQVERIAEIAEISIEEARRYLPIGEEIVVAEDSAENIWDIAAYLLKNDLYFEIEPEFPFQLEGQLTEEEKKEINEKIQNQLKL